MKGERRVIPRLAGGIVAAAAGLACADAATPTDRDSPTSARTLPELAADYWDFYLRWTPLQATALGDHRFDDRVEEISPAARDARRDQVRDLMDGLGAIEAESLGPRGRLTYLALQHELEGEVARQICQPETWVVDHREGPQVAFLNVVTVQPLVTPGDGDRMVRRWHAIADYLDDYVANLRSGLEQGRTPAAVSVSRTISQLDALLESPTEAWPLFAPAGTRLDDWPETARHGFRAAIREAVQERVRPAYARLRDFLRDELYPATRDGDRIGLAALPAGADCYGALIRDMTSLELSPREIHDMGIRELGRVRTEIEDLGAALFQTRDLSAIQSRLRGDPGMHFRWPGDIVRLAEEATARAYEAMPDWFGRLPKAELVIRPIPIYEAPHSIVAYYRPPAPDGSRPGIYFVNTYRPETRPRYQSEVLTFHESIPGHHLQTALAQEASGLPEFRKHLGATAFIEGWALYAERLADEMGLYSGQIERLGRFSYEAWRASRLVVDTGIHAFGWTRERAVEFLRENTLLAEANIENEVDRYVTSPAQALAYKLGELEILALRSEARARLGESFDIRDFHDRALENGALTLPGLREVVERWIAGLEAS